MNRGVREWLKSAANRPARDLDNRILFTGEPRSGKSTVAAQIARGLDPGFDASRVCFDITQFLALAPLLEPGDAILLDEARLRNRRGMYGSSLDLLDYFEQCGGLRLHNLICYPDSEAIDPGIPPLMNQNVRILSRGHAECFRKRVYYHADGSSTVTWEPECRPWSFGPNRGPYDVEYRAKKGLHMRAMFASEDAPSGGSAEWSPADVRGLLAPEDAQSRDADRAA